MRIHIVAEDKSLCGRPIGEQWVGSGRVKKGKYDKDPSLKLCYDCVKILEKHRAYEKNALKP